MLITENERIWYSPIQLLAFANYALKHEPSRTNKKLIDELLPVAVSVIGISEASGVQHWIQHVDRRKQAPDLRALYKERKLNGTETFHIVDVEVVTLGPHSSDDVADFILKTKLNNPKKAYGDTTVFVCHLNRKLTAIVSDVSKKLAIAKKPNQVYIVGKLKQKNVFQFNQVNPVLSDTVIIDLNQPVKPQDPAVYVLPKGSRVQPLRTAKNPYLSDSQSRN